MNRQEKHDVVAELTETFKNNNVVYLADTTGLSANDTNRFRRMLFQNGISMRMAKNTLVNIAMEQSGKDFGDLKTVLAGQTCVLVAENMKSPATTIKTFRGEKSDKPVLKGAWIDNSVYIGDHMLNDLVNLKSKEDLLGEVIGLLQSPARNVISALQSNAGQKVAGLVKALSER